MIIIKLIINDKVNTITDKFVLTGESGEGKSILEKIGCFDEQLLSGADFDFAMKLARSGNGKHIDFNLGFYLNDRSGLSTNENSLQEIERTVVELRFGLNPLNKSLIEKAKKEYKI